MGMHLMLEIGTQSVYGNVLPDFMVWNQVKELPLFWKPFYSVHGRGLGGPGAGVVRVRVRLPHLPQPHPRRLLLDHHPGAGALRLAPVQPQRDEPRRHQRPDRLQELLGFPLSEPGTQRGLYVVTALCLCGAYLLCRWIMRSPAGRVLIAIRDSETRVLFSGYSPANFKFFVFVVSAALAGVAGALYVPQVGIITPAKSACCRPSRWSSGWRWVAVVLWLGRY